MTTHLCVAGGILLALAFAHALFPRHFRWAEELSQLSLLTRQIFYVHHFFIALTVGLMGLLSISRSDQLVSTPLGRDISLGFGLFWFVRLCFQFLVYSPVLWRGKRFETFMHILFTVLWVYLTVVYVSAAAR